MANLTSDTFTLGEMSYKQKKISFYNGETKQIPMHYLSALAVYRTTVFCSPITISQPQYYKTKKLIS